MLLIANTDNQAMEVNSFHELMNTTFAGEVNALCWKRNLLGNFEELIQKSILTENITTLEPEDLLALQLSEQGNLARQTILHDWELLSAHGAQPTLNIIKQYDEDDTPAVISTDVYSFHADRSPVPTSTFLCTYYGAPSELIPNAQAQQKIHIPEIREALKKEYQGSEETFEDYLREQFYDLHYQPKPDATIISLGVGNLWRLAVEHPGSAVLPCIHRAPKEKKGEYRLLLIC